MITKLATPGVYIDEVSTLPPSIAEVDSAIPAFIGYTAKAQQFVADDLLMRATEVTSLDDFKAFYGEAPVETNDSFKISANEKTDNGTSTGTTIRFEVTIEMDATKLNKSNLYYAMKHYFANGGGRCYVVAVGKHGVDPDADKIIEGLDVIKEYDEPTLLAVPEIVFLENAGYTKVVQKMITQSSELKDRFALIDPHKVTPKNAADPNGDISGDAAAIRSSTLSVTENRYAAAYYPNLETFYNYNVILDDLILDTHTVEGVAGTLNGKTMTQIGNGSVLYNQIKLAFQKKFIILPPSPAIAGLYARVDSTKGVWKAPANEVLKDVNRPTLDISNREQENLNIDATSGKSINVIRNNFPGYGTLVWGGRTLNGNDNEWRYINVRRFFMVVEESIKKSIHWAVFESNSPQTWVRVKGMIDNYLKQKYEQGALVGSKPENAYYVKVGLGETMNSNDVFEGRMIVEIGMAVARPAEFIILRFVQVVQTA